MCVRKGEAGWRGEERVPVFPRISSRAAPAGAKAVKGGQAETDRWHLVFCSFTSKPECTMRGNLPSRSDSKWLNNWPCLPVPFSVSPNCSDRSMTVETHDCCEEDSV